MHPPLSGEGNNRNQIAPFEMDGAAIGSFDRESPRFESQFSRVKAALLKRDAVGT